MIGLIADNILARYLLTIKQSKRGGTFNYKGSTSCISGCDGNYLNNRNHCFDMRTGESADGRGYRLAPAPRVAAGPVTGEASLVPFGRPILGNSTVNRPSSGRKAQI
jgi:hypothetical protein